MKQLFSSLSLALLAGISLVSCEKNNAKQQSWTVNETGSKIEWKGSARDHFHVGSFKLSGSLKTTGSGKIQAGEFVIPISSIADYDLPDPVRQTLLDDLKSANFFNLALHPTAGFTIRRVDVYHGKDGVAGSNALVTGDFTMIGETHEISFPAKITLTADSLKTLADFPLDRTKWGMKIYTDTSKALYIYPTVPIHLDIAASRVK